MGDCARCGASPAAGYAKGPDGRRLCHGDAERPSCYERDSWDRSAAASADLLSLVGRLP